MSKEGLNVCSFFFLFFFLFVCLFFLLLKFYLFTKQHLQYNGLQMFAVEVFLHICEEERWHVLQKSIRAAIDHFLRTPPHNKPFSRSLTRQINYWSICKSPQENRLHSKSLTAAEDDPILV